MSLLTAIQGMFKSKGVDFTVEDANIILDNMSGAPQQQPNNVDISAILKDYDGINHNKKVIEETITKFQTQIQELTTKVEALSNENAELVKTIGEERAKTEQGIKVLEEKAAAEQAAKVQSIIDEAISSGRIQPENKDFQEKLKKTLEFDIDSGIAFIEALPKPVTVPTVTNNTPKNQDTKTVLTPLNQSKSIQDYISQIPIKGTKD